jgi:23S rRNA pseudouridine1911/1915/1917 synthase
VQSGIFVEDLVRSITFAVPDSYDGITLRSFLRNYIHLSARQTAKLKRVHGGITRQGKTVTAPERLRGGESVTVTFPDDEKIIPPEPMPLTVIYEDMDIIAVNKPADMAMYPCPGHGSGSLANAVSYHMCQSGESCAFRPVYRLDKDTTGIVLLAKHPFAAAQLSGKVKKTYLAVCEGMLPQSGIINSPIGLKPGHTIQRAVMPDGLKAVTQWRTLKYNNLCSFTAIHLKTGRTHQIRVHFSSIGHPLAGDDMYGGNVSVIKRQALHCAEIKFCHPVSGRMVKLRAPMPDDMLILSDSIK